MPPGPRWPASVQTLAWMTRPGPLLSRCRARYGDTFTIKFTYEGSWVMLADPGLVGQVFTGESGELNGGEANRVLGPILGSQSVILLDGEPHLHRRKLMGSSFGARHSDRQAHLIREVAEREVASWPVGGTLRLLPRMHELTLEVMMRCVLGELSEARTEELRRPLRELLDWSTEPRAIVALFSLGPSAATVRFTPLHGLLARVDGTLLREVEQRRRDPHLDERDDVLSMLVQARDEDDRPMSPRDIRDQLVTLLVAGHETSASALTWALERLLRTPPALERATAAARADQNEYLDAVCKETLRLRPVLPLVGRRVMKPIRLDGWTVPTGSTLAPCMYLLHRREDIYPRAGEFRPERFLDGPNRSFTWVPFGGGTRRCLGASFALLEMREVLRAVLAGVRLRALHPDGERMRRRAVAWAPRRGGEVVVLERLPAVTR